MFAVIYRFNVRHGFDEQFQSAWAERTREIQAQHGGLGSRLHRSPDGAWIAYAQWPDRATWDAAGHTGTEDTAAQGAMKQCCETVETLFELDVMNDLLVN
jgi:quinol monooxygenase YgiN